MNISLKLILLFLLLPILAFGQTSGIRGTVFTSEGEPLPYATIYVQETDNSISTNELGQYELRLSGGTYTILYQYLGYASEVKEIRVENGMAKINVVLTPQTYALGGVDINSKAEDPAYTVMRKAIALSKYHLLQYESYDARVYIKGTGKVLKVPGLLRKRLEKEGLDTANAFASETVSDVHYEQPNKVTEKVISIRKVGNDRSTSPMQYITASFYAPRLQESISPLSPKAFAYYRFVLEGTFEDRGVMVNKIRVIPRSRGEGVFSGHIYITENLWSIHSLNLSTLYKGFKLNARQIYQPVRENLWMPVTHHYTAGGKLYGFEGEFEYFVTMNYKDVKLNPDLIGEVTVVDEKIEERPADDVKADDLSEALNEQPVTKKEFRKMMREYEKEERKKMDEPEVVQNRTFIIDSSAYDRDSSYWEQIRPIPLTDGEKKGYQVQDSARLAYEEKKALDSAKTAFGTSFSPMQLFTGGRFKLGEKSSFQLFMMKSYFNTVDGFYIAVGGRYTYNFDSLHALSFTPRLRYAFARESFNATTNAAYRWGDKLTGSTISAEGGRYVRQIDPSEPISGLVNTVYSLLAERNYMKLYERDYVNLGYAKAPYGKWGWSADVTYSHRRELFNNSDYKLIDRSDLSYTPNAPLNVELPDTGFPDHQALIADATLTWRPGIRYYVRNGKKYALGTDRPQVSIHYSRGIDEVFGSDVDYDRLELGVKGANVIGAGGKLSYLAKVGSFLSSNKMFFPDFAHFGGNQTIFLQSEVYSSFRALPYYTFSSRHEYLRGHLDIEFKKLLVTQFWALRFTGLKEHLFTNHLYTPAAGHYFEIGYALDNVFRLARLEIAATFRDGEFDEMAWFRIGFSSSIFSFSNEE